MNIIFYLIGSFFTFLGIIIYNFFDESGGGSGTLVLNNEILIEYGILALIAGLAFFVTDYLFKRMNG